MALIANSVGAHDPLAGGGEMGALMRSIDWSKTPVGAAAHWPQSLRTALSILLETSFPMYIAWGPRFTQFYNDGFRPILGSTKHPAAMGIGTQETFKEIWETIGPMFDGVMHGTPVFLNDFFLLLDRHGFLEECYFVFCYSPIRDESGNVGGLLTTVTETTDRVLSARRLQTLQELSAQTQEAQTRQAACASAARVLGKNPQDLPYALLYLTSEDGKSARLAGITRVLAGAVPEVIELSTNEDAWQRLTEALPGRVLALPIARPGEARPAGMLLAAVSPQLKLDDKYQSFLTLLTGQLATAIASARAFEEAKARAEALAELDRAKTAFFSNISHELRTPLALMLGPARDALAKAPSLPADDVQRWQLVQRNGERLLKLVNTLLDFSRIEAGRVQASYEPIDLAALTGELASVFRAAIEAAGLRLRVELQQLDQPVYIDREMWEKIVLNLLSNAFKFTFEGEIAVALRRRGERAELSVGDTGTGIPAAELSLIFDRFHRVHGARGRTHEGSGIGLALVQELVKLHGGEVSVESTVGKGTTFSVSVPFGSSHLPKDRIDAARVLDGTSPGAEPFIAEALRWNDPRAEAARPPPAHSTGGERVLIADDNADMRDYLARLLSDRWQVEAVASGAEALAAARRSPPDLILSDVMMPGLDGFGLIAALRAEERTASIPVILLSARAGEEAKVEGRKAGADDYLVKPFSARELLARVDSQLALARLRKIQRLHRDQLKRLFMGAPVFIALLRGPEHRFELANEAYLRLVGREVVGRTAREAFPEIEGQGFFELLDRVYANGTAHVGHEVLLILRQTAGAPDKEAFITFTYEAFRDADGAIEGIAVFGFDVTELVLARRKTEALAEQAQLADRRKDEFLAMLGHELRNPLAPIATAVKIMELRGDESGKRERQVIERQVEHLSRLVDDLLDVSRIAQGKIAISKEALDIASVAAKAVELASPLFESKSHKLAIKVPRGELFVDGDPVRLAQVIGNLLTNAARYTEARGNVSLSAAREGEEVVVRVKDDGMGIAPDFLPRLFQLFFQSPRAIDRREGGLGLGLALVKSLVALHGGSVRARSEGKDKGSEFEVRLPALRIAPPAPVASQKPALPVSRPKRRVLVVDDNIDAAETLAEALVAMGHEVSIAHDGPAALAVQERFGAEVGVLDLGLPVMDGYELAARLRQLAQRPLRLIALTGYGQDQDRERSRQAGFDAHAVKPIELDELNDLISGLPAGGRR